MVVVIKHQGYFLAEMMLALSLSLSIITAFTFFSMTLLQQFERDQTQIRLARQCFILSERLFHATSTQQIFLQWKKETGALLHETDCQV